MDRKKKKNDESKNSQEAGKVIGGRRKIIMPTNNAAILVNDLVKSYKDIHVLRGISFSVQSGNIFALLGSNGAGKTTTIKILTTLIKPDKGKAEVCNFDVVCRPERVREKISLTGQNVAVDDILTGRENMRLIAKLRHIPDSGIQSEELLKQFDLLDAANRKVATYSGGMRRRLDLAMSLLGDPSVIFLDEPTTGLDPQARKTMWKIIKDLSASGITIFLTTQYLEEAEYLADHIAILHEGVIVAEGTAAELKKLLAQGHIELFFQNENEIISARNLLSDYNTELDPGNQSLTVATDGSVKQIAEILGLFEKAGINISEFAQKKPTLEDVFLSIVSEKTRRD